MSMPPCDNLSRTRFIAVIAVNCLLALIPARASETITATAHVTVGSAISAPVTISIDRFSTDAARDQLLATLRNGGAPAVRDLLLKADRIGSIQMGTVVAAIKYAYVRSTGDGRLITAITDAPLVHIGANAPGAPAKAGFDLALVLLTVPLSGPGSGELVPAGRIRLGERDAIVTDDYSDVVVRLSDVIAR